MAVRLSLPWVYTHRFYARPGAIQQVIDLILKNPLPAPAAWHLPPEPGHQHLRLFGTTWRNSEADPGAGGKGGHPAAVSSPRNWFGDSGCRIGRPGRDRTRMLIETPEKVAEAMLDFLSRHGQ